MPRRSHGGTRRAGARPRASRCPRSRRSRRRRADRARRASLAPARAPRRARPRHERSPAMRTASTSSAARNCCSAITWARSKLATRTPRYASATASRSATRRWNAARTVCRETPNRAEAASSRRGVSGASTPLRISARTSTRDTVDGRRPLARQRRGRPRAPGSCAARHRGIRSLGSVPARRTSRASNAR